MQAGKGSTPRPYSVSQKEYDTRWDAIFQRDIQCETPPAKCWSVKCQVKNQCKNKSETEQND